MTNKEMKVQIALGTLSPMRLFLKMLSMQNEDSIEKDGWLDDRKPKINRKEWDGNIHIEINDKIVFVFSSKEEFIGTFCYKD